MGYRFPRHRPGFFVQVLEVVVAVGESRGLDRSVVNPATTSGPANAASDLAGH
jgi:hypothetical protein